MFDRMDCACSDIVIYRDFSSIDKIDWWTLVEESPVASFFQTPDCYTFYASLSFFSTFVYGVSYGGKLVGVIVGYVQMESFAFRQFFTRRAIVPGGALLSSDITSSALEALLCACKAGLAESAIYVEMRNFSDYSRWKDVFVQCGFEYEEHLDFHNDTSSEEIVLQNLGKSRKRDVKKALKDGYEVVLSPSLEQVRQYYEILDKMYKEKVRTPLFPIEFFEKLMGCDDSQFVLIVKDGQVCEGVVCVKCGSVMYEWFACGIVSHTFAAYQAMVYGARNGYTMYDMMGAGQPNVPYGVRDFKAQFGGQLVEYGRFRCVMNPLLYFVGKVGVQMLRKIK